jgi:hypothetical protein
MLNKMQHNETFVKIKKIDPKIDQVDLHIKW